MRRHGKTIFLTAILAIITVFVIMDRGYTGADNTTVETDAKKVGAAKKNPGPFWTLSPDEQRWVDVEKDGLCYDKTIAVDIWDHPEKYGFKYLDDVYQLIAFKQEFDSEGNAKYTDVTVPEKLNGIPVVNRYCFEGHYELKSLRIRARYSCRNDIIWSAMPSGDPKSIKGCTGLEHYELPRDVQWLINDDLADCTTIKSLNIPKNVTAIMEDAFRGCKNLNTFTFDKFSNLNNVDGLRKTSWWKENTQKNGMTIYQKCLVDAGRKGGTITLRGDKVEKVLDSAFRNSRAKTIRLENIKTLSYSALAYNKAEKIVLGKGIRTIPEGCFSGDKKLKEIRITSKEKIIWGKSVDTEDSYYTVVGLEQEALKKNQKIDIYIYNDKLHQKSLYRANLSAKKVTLHVPAKMVSKYRDCVKCRVVSL